MDNTQQTTHSAHREAQKVSQESGDKKESMKTRSALFLRRSMEDIHPDPRGCGATGNALLDSPDELLTYTWSILRNESPLAPKASIDEWLHLLRILEYHWIIPLLYRRIGALQPECQPPDPVTHKMRKIFLASCVRCLHMERQLSEILDAFRSEDVRILVLRGAALGRAVYSDPATRQGCDLDLLVLPEQTVKARGIMQGLGYKCLGKRFEYGRDFYREENFVHRNKIETYLPVDLHWSHWEVHPYLESNLQVEAEELFDRAWKVSPTPTMSFETLHPVDALIQGAVHQAMIHRWDTRLSWICDTALLARELEVPADWETLQGRSVAWRGRVALEYSLKMAQLWFGLKMPDGFRDFSTWPRPAEEETAILSDATENHWISIVFKRCLASPSRLLRLILSSFHLLFPDPDIVRFCYPPRRNWLLPLSYLRRWDRWLRELIVNRLS